MRLLVWVFAGCTLRFEPPPSVDAVTMEQACRGARECQQDDYGCEIIPYEQLPPWCVDICANHYCCERDAVLGDWRIRVFDCVRPIEDAGIDTLPPSDAGVSDAH
jgi:hypothetical protein